MIEVIIAVTVVFAAVTALAYTATSGFGYQALSRERQAATGIADQMMEQVRGLAYAKVQAGLAKNGDDPSFGSDPHIVNCSGTYHFDPQGAGSCAGEVIATNGQAGTPPLVPHRATVSSGYPTTFTSNVYVTFASGVQIASDDPAKAPYRVTVVVSWESGGVNGVAKSITTQSLFWSPNGCVKNTTHPYAAPCQPFFFGQAQIPRGNVSITGTIEGLPFGSADLYTSGAEANGQEEQFVSTQASLMQSGGSATTDAGLRTPVGGSAAVAAGSDTDPSGTLGVYDDLSDWVPASGGSTAVSKGGASFTVTAPSGESGNGQAATAADPGGTPAQVCTQAAPQTDKAMCAASEIRQGGSLSATANFQNIVGGTDLGIATLATIGAAGTSDTVLVDREYVTDIDGQLTETATRYLGDVTLAGLPNGFLVDPTVIGQENFATQWLGYLVKLTGYSDTATATVGTGTDSTSFPTDPSASVTGGTVSYWNGGGYTTVNADQTASITPVSVLGTTSRGNAVQINISGTLDGAVPTTSSTACDQSVPPADPLPEAFCDADASVTQPLSGTISYQIWIDGAQVVDLQIQVALANIQAGGLYQRAPSEG